MTNKQFDLLLIRKGRKEKMKKNIFWNGLHFRKMKQGRIQRKNRSKVRIYWERFDFTLLIEFWGWLLERRKMSLTIPFSATKQKKRPKLSFMIIALRKLENMTLTDKFQMWSFRIETSILLDPKESAFTRLLLITRTECRKWMSWTSQPFQSLQSGTSCWLRKTLATFY